jgi:hypothetical protein
MAFNVRSEKRARFFMTNIMGKTDLTDSGPGATRWTILKVKFLSKFVTGNLKRIKPFHHED